MNRIMIIEDEWDIRDELSLLLTNEGYNVSAIEDFKNLNRKLEEFNPDLVLLDLSLPERDGFKICMDIRKKSKVPIIFVTSRDNSMDELKALNLGGDDYITKPYNIPVLLARIKTVLRRLSNTQEDKIKANGLSLDLSKGIIEYDGKSCEITKNEMKILSHLMHHPGEIISRADLIEYLWDSQIYIDDNTLSVNITRLRTKLNELGLEDYIKTKRGLGYKI